MVSCIIVSSIIADNDQSGSIDYEPEELEELCYGYAFINAMNEENNLSLGSVFIVHFRSTPPNAVGAFGVDSLRDLSSSRYI